MRQWRSPLAQMVEYLPLVQKVQVLSSVWTLQGCQQQGSNHVPIMMSKGQAINLIYNNNDIWHIVVFLSLKRIAEFCFVLSDIYKNTKECEHLINMLVTPIIT